MNSSGLYIMQSVASIAQCGTGEGGNGGHDGGSVGARNGFALALHNARRGRWVVPLDFVRAVARSAARCAELRRVRCAFADYLVSDGVRDEPPFTARRAYWSRYCESAASGPGVGLSGGWLRHRWRDEFEPGTDCGALDAPEYVAAGSHRWIDSVGSGGFVSGRLFVRGALCHLWH